MKRSEKETDHLISGLLTATEEALQAARIDHFSALEKALLKRRGILADIWGFDSQKPLPEHDTSWVRCNRPKYSDNSKKDLEKIRSMETRLFRAMSAARMRNERQRSRLEQGRKYLYGVREQMAGNPQGRRLDCSG